MGTGRSELVLLCIVWMEASSGSELLEISCLAVRGWRAELLILLQGCSRVAVGGVGISCKSLLRHWIAPLLPWCRDYVPVPPVAELMGLCTSWSSGCHAVLLYWWAESCWKYFSRARKRNGPLCCFMSFKTVAFHFLGWKCSLVLLLRASLIRSHWVLISLVDLCVFIVIVTFHVQLHPLHGVCANLGRCRFKACQVYFFFAESGTDFTQTSQRVWAGFINSDMFNIDSVRNNRWGHKLN